MIEKMRTADRTRRPASVGLTVVLLALASCLAAGCDSSSAPPRDAAPDEQPAPGGSQGPASGNEQGTPAAERPTSDTRATAQQVLESLVDAYEKAASYADAGRAELVVQPDPMKISGAANFSVTVGRPDRIRVEVYQAMVVSDGRQMHAALEYLPGQVLTKDAPAELTLEWLFSDRLLAEALSSGFAGPPPQLMLMLEEDPLRALLQDARETTLLEPATIGDRPCHRVRITRSDGTAVFWIDRQSWLLRRIVFPTDAIREAIERQTGRRAEHVSLTANFHGARLDGEVDPAAFQFEVPEDAELVQLFVPPDPGQLLGKKLPDFSFVDLQGNRVTSDSLAGKIVVLDFWATYCPPCRTSLPNLQKTYRQYRDHAEVAFYAVSVDQPDVTDQSLVETFRDLNVDVPILRDRERHMGATFRSTNIPAMFIIDAQGVLQDYEIGADPQLPDILPAKLDKLLAGEDIYHEPLKAYQDWRKQYEEQMQAARSEASDSGRTEQQEIPYAELAPRSDPQTFRLVPSWKCTELRAPGNMLVVEPPNEPPKLLVVDALKSVAEVSLDGELIANHELDIDQSEVVNTLRSAVTPDGKRRYVAFALLFAQQRFHLLDENLQVILSYPQDALEHNHAGIADVQLVELEAGQLQVTVGYWGVVGVEAVSLEGKRVWSNRSLSNVMRIAPAQPDAQGRRRLVCINTTGSLAILDAEGRRAGDLSVPNRTPYWIVSAELQPGGPLRWSALCATRVGENTAIGLDLAGKELWEYSLPDGVHPQPVERIVPGRLFPDRPGQWLLPGPDGSVHVVGADGRPLDRFSFGVAPAGLATAEHNGQTLLITASQNGLEAWRVDQGPTEPQALSENT